MWGPGTHVWSPRHIFVASGAATRNHSFANYLPFLHLNEFFLRRRLSMTSALGPGMTPLSTLAWIAGHRTWIRQLLGAALLVSGPALAAEGQGYGTMQPMATRADLTTLADRLSRGSAEDRTKASALRVRLRDGDFRPGDRIALVIEGNVAAIDTVPVTAGSKINLKDIGDIPLAGVLRSELQGHLTKQISKYIRDANVRATPLIRLSVLGPVAKPGFYFMPTDIPLSDAIMRAGGPGSTADLDKSVIRRDTEHLYDSRNTRSALSEGLTLDQLSLRDGDSIEIGEKSTRGWQQMASVIGVVTSLVFAISYGFARR
jgi:protein involved in polysaccharide export with SLBB domain